MEKKESPPLSKSDDATQSTQQVHKICELLKQKLSPRMDEEEEGEKGAGSAPVSTQSAPQLSEVQMAKRETFKKRGRQPSSTFSSTSSLDKIRSLHEEVTRALTHSKAVQDSCKCLVLTDEQLHKIMARMEACFEEGLRPETAKTATVKMLPAYIRDVSVGDERGEFLALDLGGTNFRVLLITLKGETKSTMTSKIFRVPDAIQKGAGTELFDHIAACLAKFMEEHKLKDREKLPLGFTFSFPCQQEGLTSAKLVNWTKGFNASGVVGNDVVQMLREACLRRGDIDIDVVAVLNDTTGTMLACSFLEKHCYIGVIVGTGCNAAYMESLDKIYKLKGQILPEEDGLPAEMCINTEWGGFGDDGALDEFLTEFDQKLDKKSVNPGRQRFEKTISGMYMGEIVRYVLEDLARKGMLLSGRLDQISEQGCFPTKLVSDIEKQMQNEEEENPFARIEEMLQEVGITGATAADCANIAYVCSLVSTRAAFLCACGIASLLKRVKRPNVTVGVDGSVYRFHPTFGNLLDSKIEELLDGKQEFILVLSEDGSGKGAAVAAAVATRMSKITQAKQQEESAAATVSSSGWSVAKEKEAAAASTLKGVSSPSKLAESPIKK